MIEWVGYMAAFLTTACYVPQALHIIRSQKTDGISLPAYCLLTLGIVMWFMYGIGKNDWPIIIANGSCLILMGIILTMKIRLG